MRGLGDTYFNTTQLDGGALASQKIYPNPISSFNYAPDVTTNEAQGFRGGRLQTVGSAPGNTTQNFTVQTQYVRRADRPLLTGHLPKNKTAVQFPVLKAVTVPTASPYEITDAAITPTNVGLIQVFDDTYGPLTHTADASTAPANESEVQVDTTNNKLIFAAAAAGRTITYRQPFLFTGKGYGGAGANTSLGKLAFYGRTYDFGDEESLIWFPELSLVGITALPLTGDVPTYELAFLAAVPQSWDVPYELLELPTAT